jgi:hypothetical protein
VRRALRVEVVETGVERYYETFKVHPERAMRIRDVVQTELEAERSAAAEDQKRAVRRVAALKEERKALLQAHYAKAVPTDLLREEMERLTRDIAQAEAESVKAAQSIEYLTEVLEVALYVAGTCNKQYQTAPPSIRRQINQGFFRKLYVGADGEVARADLTEPFAQVLVADMVAQVTSTAGKPSEAQIDSRKADSSAGPLTSAFATSGRETGTVGVAVSPSVNEMVLVPLAGFEPATHGLGSA